MAGHRPAAALGEEAEVVGSAGTETVKWDLLGGDEALGHRFGQTELSFARHALAWIGRAILGSVLDVEGGVRPKAWVDRGPHRGEARGACALLHGRQRRPCIAVRQPWLHAVEGHLRADRRERGRREDRRGTRHGSHRIAVRGL